METFKIICIFLTLACSEVLSADTKQKNIIFILTDDLGFNDLSIRGNNEIITPNIDALFYHGISLDRYYTSPLCTPTRSSILTGKYAHRVGMQHGVNWNHQPYGLGLEEKLMPEYFKEAGYDTHAIGKWHLGMHQLQYWPTKRGFDTFNGNLGVYVDYWSREFKLSPVNFPGNNYTTGYDFRDNESVDRSDMGEYITDLLTKRAIKVIENSGEKPFFMYLAHTAMHRANDANPLAAKSEDVKLYEHIYDLNRRNYAAMVKAMDDSIGDLIEALTLSGKLNDTIIVFTTDNGGPTAYDITHPNTASNFPLRGLKGLAWDGGIRVDCAIYAPWLPSGVKREKYFHTSDWLLTLATLSESGIKLDRSIDGNDLSEMILTNSGPEREEVQTINPIDLITSIIYKEWKFMNSSYVDLNGEVDTWLGSNNNFDRASDTYFSRVLNSKVSQSISNFSAALSEEKVQGIRSGLKVECTEPITACNIIEKPCLFNILKDPCERNNLAEDPNYETILNEMKERLANAMKKVVPIRNMPGDFLSDPSLHDGVWTWWQEDSDESAGGKVGAQNFLIFASFLAICLKFVY